jgi:hypothetical protein
MEALLMRDDAPVAIPSLQLLPRAGSLRIEALVHNPFCKLPLWYCYCRHFLHTSSSILDYLELQLRITVNRMAIAIAIPVAYGAGLHCCTLCARMTPGVV